MLLMSGGPRGAPSAILAAGGCGEGWLLAVVRHVSRLATAKPAARTMSETLQLRGVLKGHEGASQPLPARSPSLAHRRTNTQAG
jgi:hypothetical protein